MPIKTLLVDDERALLEQAKLFLEKIDRDIEVHTVPSPENALDIMEDKNFDVIVSDYDMPGMNGLEFLEHLKNERDSDTPFIMFTGKGREEVAMKSMNLGAERYIQKGGDPKSQYEILADAVSQAHEHYRTQKERERYISELEFLNDILLNVSRMKSTDEICKYIAEKIHSLNEDDYVIVSLYDREEENIRIRALEGFDDHQQLVDRFLHSGEGLIFDPDLEEEWPEIYSSGNLERMPEGIYSSVKGTLTREEAEEIEDVLGLKGVYSVNFSLENKPYGSINIYKTSEEEVRFSSAIETIASHISVVIQRRQYEEELKKSRGKIERSENK